MRSIKQIRNVKDKTVIVRVDFNVPIQDGKVQDDFKIRSSMPTIKFLTRQGAKVILITHIGRGEETALPTAKALGKFIKVKFVPDMLGLKAKKAVSEMASGDIILFENLRKNKGEKSCNKNFAKRLAQFADLYVNEAFAVSHREDASIVLLPKLLPAYAGFQLEKEVRNLSVVFKNPKHPFLFILGGAKFETKLPIIKKYIKTADKIFIGGALANDFLKAEGYGVGKSLVDDTNYDIEKILKNKKLILPVDVVIKSGDKLINKKINQIEKNENVLDIGSETVKNLAPLIKKSKLILWNGPLGRYEDGGGSATKKILKLVAASKAESIIGGGDTVILISKLKMENKFSFVSTGGGATLDFLANGTLPGIKALS